MSIEVKVIIHLLNVGVWNVSIELDGAEVRDSPVKITVYDPSEARIHKSHAAVTGTEYSLKGGFSLFALQ